jgi:hypothetical protein
MSTGWPDRHGLGGGDRPDAVPVGETGSEVVHNGQQLSAVGVELLAGLLQRACEPLDLGMTHGLVAAGIGAPCDPAPAVPPMSGSASRGDKPGAQVTETTGPREES